jgi:polar amino acid transport system substrate-binding protein
MSIRSIMAAIGVTAASLLLAGSVGAQSAALLPPALKAKGVITLETSPGTPPLTLLAEDNKTNIGVEPDLMREIATRLGLTLEITSVSFETLIPSLRGGRFDVAASSLTDTEERRAVFDFVDYLVGNTMIVVPGGNPKKIVAFDDFCGKRTAKLAGSQINFQLDKISEDCEKKGRPPIEMPTFKDTGSIDVELRSGRMDFGAQTATRAYYVAKNSGGKFEVVKGLALDDAKKGIMLAKGSPLVPAIRAALEEMLADGTYRQILSKWDVADLALDKVTVNER